MLLIHPLIDPVILSLGIFEIRWYGLAYLIGFISGIYFIKKLNNYFKKPLENKSIDNFFTWSIIGVILGGRVGYVIFYDFSNFIINPISIFYIWKGGMSFHGGLIGIILTMILFCKIYKISFYKLSDLVSSVAPIGIFFGRIANFINIELNGRPTEFAFAIIYPTIDNQPRHPSQIYEAFFEGFILFFLLYFLALRNFKKNFIGINTAIFLILYGFFRFFLEFLREPDLHIGLFFNLYSMGQLLSIPMIIFGLFIFYKKKKAHDF